METMGGSNEEHMLLCFNRAAHCARKGILYLLFRLVTMKIRALPEPVELTISIRFPFFPTPLLFDFNSPCIHFAYCTYVTCFVPQIEEQWCAKLKGSRATQSKRKLGKVDVSSSM